MKEDFSLLKVGTQIVTDCGVLTEISEGYIYRPTSIYFKDAWECVQKQHPDWDFSDGDAIDYDNRFVEIVSDPWLFTNNVFGDYIVLDLSKMTPEEINWDEDYIRVDVSENASYERELHDSLMALRDIELPRDIYELNEDELIELYNSVGVGSMYYSDYNNSFHVDRKQVSDYVEGFETAQYDEYGEDEYEKHLTAEEFADYVA